MASSWYAMAMEVVNPISNAGVLALDAAESAEERLQSLLALWLGFYFSGEPFTTRASGGGTEQKTFIKCDLAFQEDTLPENAVRPVIHVLFTAMAAKRQDFTEQATGHTDCWQITLMTKVPGNLSASTMKGLEADQVAGRLAGQVAWLVASGERHALAEKGVGHLQMGAITVMPATTWHARLITGKCETRREQAR